MSVGPLDEVTRARVVGAAVRAAPAPARRSWLRRIDAGVAGGAAAAVAAVGLLVAGVVTYDGAGDDDAATGARYEVEADGERGAADDGGAELGPLEDAPQDPTTSTPVAEFGEVGETERLRAAVDQQLDAGSRTVPPDATVELSRGAQECLAARARDLDVTGDPVLRGPATYDGEPVEVVVYRSDAGEIVALVLSLDGCTLRTTLVLPAEP
jgi:hypothetical protein